MGYDGENLRWRQRAKQLEKVAFRLNNSTQKDLANMRGVDKTERFFSLTICCQPYEP